MSAPRFYCPITLQAQQTLVLPNALAHHATRVLRLRDGAALTLFNGQGGEYPATLQVQGKTITAQLGDHNAREAESPLRITLVQGLTASGTMDSIIEKAVECGVHTLVPVVAQRSPPQPEGARLERRLAHWQRIVQAASAQCGRNRLMQIAPPQAFATYVRTATAPVQLLCHPDSRHSLAHTLVAHTQALSLYTGPEGGWSHSEQQLAADQNMTCVRFGDRVLRAETASIALVAAVHALLVPGCF